MTARFLGVSRQSLYNWRSGSEIKSHNIVKVENLRRAADVLATSEAPLSRLQIGRKLPGGKTLLELIANGEDGADAAHSLVSMLNRETEQRKALNARFAGRKPISDGPIGDGMSPLRDDEKLLAARSPKDFARELANRIVDRLMEGV
jgi:hypothetical protein